MRLANTFSGSGSDDAGRFSALIGRGTRFGGFEVGINARHSLFNLAPNRGPRLGSLQREEEKSAGRDVREAVPSIGRLCNHCRKCWCRWKNGAHRSLGTRIFPILALYTIYCHHSSHTVGKIMNLICVLFLFVTLI